MTHYCSECRRLVALADRCPHCHRKHTIREAESNDPVLLLSLDLIHADIWESVIAEQSIPYVRQCAAGAGLAMYTGLNVQLYRFYVPYQAYRAARTIVVDLFGDDDYMMHNLTADPEEAPVDEG